MIELKAQSNLLYLIKPKQKYKKISNHNQNHSETLHEDFLFFLIILVGASQTPCQILYLG
jgi:hypothetical protein